MVDDESAPIPFVVGEVFVNINIEEAKVLVKIIIPSGYYSNCILFYFLRKNLRRLKIRLKRMSKTLRPNV